MTREARFRLYHGWLLDAIQSGADARAYWLTITIVHLQTDPR